jgi:DNA-binding NarL/FixJ family response regulator
MSDRDEDFVGLLKLAAGLTRLGFLDLRELGRAKAAWDYDLSRHEIQILELIADGLDNNQIAEQTGVAEENGLAPIFDTTS